MIFERRRRHSFCAGVYAFFAFVLFVPRGQLGHHLSISGGKRRRMKQRTTRTKDIKPPENKNRRKNQGRSISLFWMFSPLGTPRCRLPPPNPGQGGSHRSFVNAQFRLECIWLSLHPHPQPTCYCRRGRVQYPFMISSTTTVRKTETKEEGKKTSPFV